MRLKKKSKPANEAGVDEDTTSDVTLDDIEVSQKQVGEAQKKAQAEVEQQKAAHQYIRTFPVDGAPVVLPPSINQGEGRDIFKDESGAIVVVLDQGCFRYLWGKVEEHAKRDYVSFHTMPNSGVYRASRDTIKAVRQAAIDHGVVPEPEQPKKRKLKKRVAK